ncbi:GlsB/YeaQ/YmgE family stress response membrane protein [Mycobacterium dioxanotrophicus]|uniref:GlsB/YeaQ/YmgE family stress response membrane protein n=1 Tax=Mycobacterium dioxanotrophicus TaxID=482462 RepID=A0A1Y0C404_9MYCO|nr:GlsB/YeaQ/YmgE family stress response membrane protein [Mycobacterium dioxanotrophicus]ART69825.1 GlsB/YeaQ/YmgE family stress response membrane protein [Mycobacterium dioxanotrophicus]
MDVMATTEFLALNLDGKTGIGWLGYIVIGGIAGWLASKFVQGRGQGILMNIITGVVGAFAAGLVLNLLHVDVNSGGYWFTFFVAFGGAVVLLWIVGLVRRGN